MSGKKTRIWRIMVAVGFLSTLPCSFARADALVVTKAMTASTIAEVFVEEKEVRVEIEVGATDLKAFANILPDEIYQKLTGRNEPVGDRVEDFLEQDWVLLADGHPVPGILRQVTPAKSIVRDQVTGQPLAEQPDNAELAIHLTLTHALERRPATLTLRPLADEGGVTATIGFICYHNGLPVNDFRYLGAEVTLDLDWGDPWYSQFRHPNLRRQFDAPLSAFLYVEPYEVRKEIIVRPRDLRAWVDLPGADDGVIRVDQQGEMKKQIAAFLSAKAPVWIDGKRAKGRLDRIHFIHRTLRTTGIIEPPVDLDATSATLGVIFVYPIDQLPDEVSMRWDLFGPKIQSVPAVASDEAGGLPGTVTADAPVLTWENHLTNPTTPSMVNVANPTSPRQFTIPIVSAACVAVAIFIAGWHCYQRKEFSRYWLFATIAAMIVAVLSLSIGKLTFADPFAEATVLSEPEATDVVSGLLFNVYRSFDHHDENLIYDRLAKSISGDLLADVYLETRKNMEVKNQGGLRISVKEVQVTDLEAIDSSAEAPKYRCRWRVSGWIGHWGHIHRRENEHVAHVTLGVREGVWKITSMEMLDQQAVADVNGRAPT